MAKRASHISELAQSAKKQCIRKDESTFSGLRGICDSIGRSDVHFMSTQKPSRPVPVSDTSSSSNKESLLSFMDLPPEIRQKIYKYTFSPNSKQDCDKANHDNSLSLTELDADDKACQKDVLNKSVGFHFSRPAQYLLLFTSRQIYVEAFPLLAKATVLRISSKMHPDTLVETHCANLPFLAAFYKEVTKHTKHLIVDQKLLHNNQTILTESNLPSQQQRSIHALCPKLKRLTVLNGPPGTVQALPPGIKPITGNGAFLLSRASIWPSLYAGLPTTLDQDARIEMQGVTDMLREFISQSKPIRAEYTWTLSLSGGITTDTASSNSVFQAMNVYVDFKTREIIDVTFLNLGTRSQGRCCGRAGAFNLYPPEYRTMYCEDLDLDLVKSIKPIRSGSITKIPEH